jgi:hypothetical protein
LAARRRRSTRTPRIVDGCGLHEIQQLYARYNTAIDAGDEETWASTFTADGVFNNNVTGRDALVKFVRDWRERGNPIHLRHWNTNLLIQKTPDGAKGSVYLSLLDVGVKPPAITTTAPPKP